MINSHLGEKPVGILLLKYSIPSIVGMVVTSLYNVVDRMFIGRIPKVGADAMSGIGVTLPMQSVILAFVMLIGIGATANISLYLGKGESEKAQRTLENAFVLSFITGAFITTVGLIFCEGLLRLFGASDEIIPYAKDYITILLYGTTINTMCFTLNHTIRGDGSPITASLTILIGCVLNIALDPLFIFTFNMGIKGAAIATVISQTLSLIWVLYYYFGKTPNNPILSKLLRTSRLKIKSLRLSIEYIMPMLQIGAAPFTMQTSACISVSLLNNTLRSLGGDTAIGASTVIHAINMLFLMVIFGINQGSQPIVGYNYGAKQYDRVKKTFLLAVTAGTIFLSIGFGITQLFTKQLILLFNDDPALVKIAVEGAKINLFTMPIVAIIITGANLFQQIGKSKTAFFLSLMRQVLLLIPALLLLPRIWKMFGVWAAQPVCDVISCVVVLVFVIIQLKKMKNSTMSKHEERR